MDYLEAPDRKRVYTYLQTHFQRPLLVTNEKNERQDRKEEKTISVH
jgi:hypothetical protein